MKDQYKKLAKMAFLFQNKSGYILAANEQNFIALVREIESSDATACHASHKEAVAKKIVKNAAAEKLENHIEDYCDKVGDRSAAAVAEAISEFKKK